MNATTTLAAALLQLAALPALAIPAPAGVPAPLQASGAEEAAFVLAAEGVHVFECKPGGPAGFAWTFVAPDATLYEGTRSVAIHQVPGLWESTSDRSSVTATVRSALAAGAGDLPWALLGASPLGE
ncbi:MAG TPA: DUF3455 domain-containing protein, partial [Myxococcota bacterium]|nr:DUF3455 domain-containing protein [Myxococcota bacterium]